MEVPKSRRWVVLAAVTFNFVFWWSFWLYRPFDFGTYLPESLPWHKSQQTLAVPGLPALRQLCDKTEWKEGLVLQCYSAAGDTGLSIRGGLNNARNRVTTCLRLAIDAGASTMVIPSVTMRNPDNLTDTNDGTACSSIWFDAQHTVDTMRENCPQMTLNVCPKDDVAADPDGDAAVEVIRDEEMYHMALDNAPFKGSFRRGIEETMRRQSHQGNITVIQYGDTYCGWDFRKSGELEPSPIHRELFQTLRHAPNLCNISDQIRGKPELDDGAYFGVHLRGGQDWPSDWGSSHDQLTLHASEIGRVHRTVPKGDSIRAIYASSDDPALVESFREMMLPLGFQVYNKFDLLADRPALLEEEAGLDFDAKGAVEYEVLVNARVFLGTAMSSMSWTIAYERTMHDKQPYFDTHVYPKDKDGEMAMPVTKPLIRGTDYTGLLLVKDFDLSNFLP
ncbi:unnamed protein product [Discula destructiva]